MYWSERITLFIFDQVEVTTSLLFLRTAGAEVHGESTGPTAAVPFPGSGRATAALRAAAAAADQPGPSSGQGHAYPHTFVQVPYWYLHNNANTINTGTWFKSWFEQQAASVVEPEPGKRRLQHSRFYPTVPSIHQMLWNTVSLNKDSYFTARRLHKTIGY